MIPIVRIVIESGAINTAYLLAYTITLQSGSRAIEIMASIVSVQIETSTSGLTQLEGHTLGGDNIRDGHLACRSSSGARRKDECNKHEIFRGTRVCYRWLCIARRWPELQCYSPGECIKFFSREEAYEIPGIFLILKKGMLRAQV